MNCILFETICTAVIYRVYFDILDSIEYRVLKFLKPYTLLFTSLIVIVFKVMFMFSSIFLFYARKEFKYKTCFSGSTLPVYCCSTLPAFYIAVYSLFIAFL